MKTKTQLLIIAATLLLVAETSGHAQLLEQLKASEYDASTGVWTASTGSNADSSGTNPTLVTNATANGSSAVGFDGSESLTLETGVPAESSYTIFAYILPSSDSGDDAILGSPFNGPSPGLEYRISDGTQGALEEDVSSLGSGTGTLSTSSFSLIDVTVSGSGGAFRLNGEADGTTSDASFGEPITLIGSQAFGENFSGKVAEIDIYNGVLTSTQISSVESRFQASYAAVPEPSTYLLFGLSAAALLFLRRLRPIL